jgi:hypothetical protein
MKRKQIYMFNKQQFLKAVGQNVLRGIREASEKYDSIKANDGIPLVFYSDLNGFYILDKANNSR